MSEADSIVVRVLQQSQRIALVGASNKPERASYRVMAFLLSQGYDVIPVNPVLAGRELLGRQVVPSLSAIAQPIDLVDIFRNAEDAAESVDEAIASGARAVWMQLGVINEVAAGRAREAGLDVVMDRCPKIEIPRLGIERNRPQ